MSDEWNAGLVFLFWFLSGVGVIGIVLGVMQWVGVL